MNKLESVVNTMSGGADMKQYHSGENCPSTGKYSEFTKDGKKCNADIDVDEGQRFPPTQEKGHYFKLQK